MVPLLIGATALKIGSDIASASAERRAADNKATYLRAQAARRLAKGKQEAGSILTQGEMQKTQFATDVLSRGGSRQILAQDLSLEEISNRAKIEADMALEDAEYEARMLQEDASATSRMGREGQKLAILGGIGTGLDTAYKYKIKGIE